MATTPPLDGVGEERAYELEVGELPPPPPPDESGPSDPAPEPSAPVPGKKPELGVGWTHDDLAVLLGWVRGPYEKLAMTTGDTWIELSDKEALAIAVPMTMWMPVGWVRNSGGRMSPLMGAVVTAAALVLVTAPRAFRFVREHPEFDLDIEAVPWIRTFIRRRKANGPAERDAGDAGARSRPTEARPEGDRSGDPRPGAGARADGADFARSRLTGVDPRDL